MLPFAALFGFDGQTIVYFALLVVVIAWLIGNWKLPHWRKGAERRV